MSQHEDPDDPMVEDRGALPLRIEQDPEAWRAEARRHRGRIVIGVVIVVLAAIAEVGLDAVGLFWAGLAIGVLFSLIFAVLALRASRHARTADTWLWTVREDGLEYPKVGLLPWEEIDHLHLTVRGAAAELKADDTSVEQVHLSAYVRDPDAVNARLVAEGFDPRFSQMFTDVFRDGTHTVPAPKVWVPIVESLAERHRVVLRRE